MDKNIKIISTEELDNFVDELINDSNYEVNGVKSKGERFVFAPLDNADELRLDYDVTILPPKKYFLPQYEDMMKFNLQKPFEVEESDGKQACILIGVHPYDIVALQQMDKVYLDQQEDDFYQRRREKTMIIGVDIQRVAERSFAADMNTHVVDSGFDLLLTKLSDTKYAVTIGSSKGARLLDRYASTSNAGKTDVEKVEQIRNKTAKKFKTNLTVDKEKWSPLLVANYAHKIWETRSEKCLECSSCTMVCPTCYCYDVKDDVSLDLKEGKRIRTWDGCLLKDFTKVGSGEIFREDVSERYRHRFFRKGNYLHQRYGFVACVGCGRCAIACLPDIADPCDLINELSEVGGEGDPKRFFIEEDVEIKEKGTIHIPRSATITNMERLTDTEMFFEIELDDGEPLDHSPGQFVEVSVFGVGEAPISVSSPPADSPRFELVVRKVGNVTNRLFEMKPGDKVGIRGPFGNGFNVKDLENKHILFATGGIGMVPARSLIKYVLDENHRHKFKNIAILYGSKIPSDVLFKDEIEEWKDVPKVQCKLTVDECPEGECWEGCVGLITTLFPKIDVDDFDLQNTMAVVVGPPVMYKFVIKCLQTMGIPDENILVSLERRMKCGVGKCGHCQINGVYVCKEGPVFNYDKIKDLPEALG